MTYCSIEEAWGTPFISDKKTKTPYQNIVPENANEDEIIYSDVEFEEDKIYLEGKDDSGKKIKKKEIVFY